MELSEGLFPPFKVGGVSPTAATPFVSSELKNNKKGTYMFVLSCEISLREYFKSRTGSSEVLTLSDSFKRYRTLSRCPSRTIYLSW